MIYTSLKWTLAARPYYQDLQQSNFTFILTILSLVTIDKNKMLVLPLLCVVLFVCTTLCDRPTTTAWHHTRLCHFNCIHFILMISLISFNLLIFRLVYILCVTSALLLLHNPKICCLFLTVIAYLLGLDINRLDKKRNINSQSSFMVGRAASR